MRVRWSSIDEDYALLRKHTCPCGQCPDCLKYMARSVRPLVYKIWLPDSRRFMVGHDVTNLVPEDPIFFGLPHGGSKLDDELSFLQRNSVEGSLVNFRGLRLAAALELVPVEVATLVGGNVESISPVEWSTNSGV